MRCGGKRSLHRHRYRSFSPLATIYGDTKPSKREPYNRSAGTHREFNYRQVTTFLEFSCSFLGSVRDKATAAQIGLISIVGRTCQGSNEAPMRYRAKMKNRGKAFRLYPGCCHSIDGHSSLPATGRFSVRPPPRLPQTRCCPALWLTASRQSWRDRYHLTF